MITADEPPLKKQALEGSKSDLDKCEMCGKADAKMKKGSRSCADCSKRKPKNGQDKKLKDGDGAADMDSGDDSSSSAKMATVDDDMPKINPLKWTVSEVVEFIKALPGCREFAEDFAMQEIDGQALMLLKEDHLMSAMAMKLGPALKIVAKIDTMRATPPGQQSPDK